MYNKYMQNDMNAFSELYRPVEYETEREQDIPREKELAPPERERRDRFDLKRLLHGLDVDKMGILPLVLLLLLLLDVDDEERLIIIVLAVIFGI
ncbi:MAG: hypothetical protein IJ299_04890 [Oscillospiraceae bacterium]|nr:hypothetical protein [Oscillospiraceae bacterium]